MNNNKRELEILRSEQKACAVDRAAEHIEQTVSPSDVGGRMVLAAFCQDAMKKENILPCPLKKALHLRKIST